MKKSILALFLALALAGAQTPFLGAESKDDIQAIKKAVKENPQYEAGSEVKWFKVLVTDTRTNKDKVRITLPISLVEVFFKLSENKHLCLDHATQDIDFKELFAELKKLGPMALIEVYEEDEIVKIWLE